MAEFARKELERYGWKEGAGLGKQEDGRSQPIKVSLKMDKTGVGHDPGKEFTDHWWLRVFNEAAQKIGTKKQVSAASEDQAKLKQDKKAEDRKNFYRGFVKSSTLTNGVEKRDEKSDSSSEDEESQIVTNSVPTLDDIHKFCGGATGHRAARFGIKMKGKLARVAHHDKLYEELSKAAPKDSSSSVKSSDDNLDPTDSIVATDLCEKVEDDKKRSKKKEKKKKKNKQCMDDVSENTQVLSETDSGANEKQKKKKRKKDKRCLEDVRKETKVTSEVIPHSPEMDSGANEKQKKKKKYLGDVGEHTDVNTEITPGASETDCSENVKQKKKKRKEEEPPTVNDTDNMQVIVDNEASIRLQDVKSKDGSRKRQKTENSTESVETTSTDRKRKKKHKRKRDVEDKSVQEDSCITEEVCDVKKKKKRKKDKV